MLKLRFDQFQATNSLINRVSNENRVDCQVIGLSLGSGCPTIFATIGIQCGHVSGKGLKHKS